MTIIAVPANACTIVRLQNNAIASLVKVMREAHAAERKTLFVVGSYHIGKERAFFGAARALGFKIWCHPAKKKVWIYRPVRILDSDVPKPLESCDSPSCTVNTCTGVVDGTC